MEENMGFDRDSVFVELDKEDSNIIGEYSRGQTELSENECNRSILCSHRRTISMAGSEGGGCEIPEVFLGKSLLNSLDNIDEENDDLNDSKDSVTSLIEDYEIHDSDASDQDDDVKNIDDEEESVDERYFIEIGILGYVIDKRQINIIKSLPNSSVSATYESISTRSQILMNVYMNLFHDSEPAIDKMLTLLNMSFKLYTVTWENLKIIFNAPKHQYLSLVVYVEMVTRLLYLSRKIKESQLSIDERKDLLTETIKETKDLKQTEWTTLYQGVLHFYYSSGKILSALKSLLQKMMHTILAHVNKYGFIGNEKHRRGIDFYICEDPSVSVLKPIPDGIVETLNRVAQKIQKD